MGSVRIHDVDNRLILRAHGIGDRENQAIRIAICAYPPRLVFEDGPAHFS